MTFDDFCLKKFCYFLTWLFNIDNYLFIEIEFVTVFKLFWKEVYHDDLMWHSFGTNLETLAWHPTQNDWFGSVKNKVHDKIGKLSVLINW